MNATMNATMNAIMANQVRTPVGIHALTDAQLADIIREFVCQRPGLDPSNYSDWAMYRRESGRIANARARALRLLRHIERRQDAMQYVRDTLARGMGRLYYDAGTGELRYRAGQYWPTEYRAAVANLLQDALKHAQRRAARIA